MPTSKSKPHWNELEFLSWKEFKQMAPSIIRLEISRIGKIIDSMPVDEDFRNTLVKARYELKKFIECLEQTRNIPLDRFCHSHLSAAIMCVSIENSHIDETSTETLKYILDRLNYVDRRIALVYSH